VTLEAEASDPVSIGFELRPLETLVRPEVNVTGDGCNDVGEKGGSSETCQQTHDPTARKARPSSKGQTNQRRAGVPSKWQRHARNRQGSSEEVLFPTASCAPDLQGGSTASVDKLCVLPLPFFLVWNEPMGRRATHRGGEAFPGEKPQGGRGRGG